MLTKVIHMSNIHSNQSINCLLAEEKKWMMFMKTQKTIIQQKKESVNSV